eukprot:3214788-Prymnesium_polylepis.3
MPHGTAVSESRGTHRRLALWPHTPPPPLQTCLALALKRAAPWCVRRSSPSRAAVRSSTRRRTLSPPASSCTEARLPSASTAATISHSCASARGAGRATTASEPSHARAGGSNPVEYSGIAYTGRGVRCRRPPAKAVRFAVQPCAVAPRAC